MRKSTSLLLSGILVSGMVLGTVVTPATVNASSTDTATTQSDSEVTVNVKYYLRGETGGILGVPLFTKQVTGKIGSIITEVPDGYAFVNGQNPVISETEPNPVVEVAKKATATVNYIDPNGNILKSFVINGAEGDYYSLTSDLPSGYYWDNAGEGGISLNDGKTYNLPVAKSISNTVIFKTSDDTEVGRTTIRSGQVGDVISIDGSNLPSGYSADRSSVTLQEADNTQIVTVTRNPTNVSSFDGVITVKNNIFAAYLYNIKGEKISNRALSGNSSWKTFNRMTLNNKEYYQVATNEWIPADNVDVTSQDSNNSSIDGNNTVTSSDIKELTTKDVGASGVALYKANGTLIKNRALGSNSSWQTDKMATINGVTMYRVASDEWIPETSIIK